MSWRVSKIIIFFLLLSICQNLYAASIVQIKIEGVTGELLKNVQAHLTLEQQKNHPRLSAHRIRRLHKRALEDIQKALQPFGYYRVKMTTAELIPPKAGQTKWIARYVIEPGKPLKVIAVDVLLSKEATQDSAFKKLQSNFPVKVGETLNHPKYEKAKRLLRNLAEERGFFAAQFTKHEIRIDEQAYTASILLDFEAGRRYRFGNVTFKQDLFYESLMQRFLTFKPGDFYTSSALLAFKNALTNSEYFGRAEVQIDRSSPTQDFRLPIQAILTPRKPDKYSAGIGYGTDTGVRSSLEWKRRYVNRHGHHFSAKAELAEIRQSFTARYSIPTGQNINDFLALTAGYRKENTDTSESEVFLLGISKHHSRTFFNTKLNEIIGIEYRDEKYTIGSDIGHAKLLMPNVNWSYITADNRIYTLRGHKIQLSMRGALSDIGSNTSFLQTRLNATFIRQLLKNGRVIARGDAGYSAISLLDGEFHALPPSIRFFAGGDRSVRGYDYQTLGPQNMEGQVIGGKNLLVGSLEYEHKILEKWSLAIFYDVGNAFNDFSESLKHGAGLGVRWQSPVGLIRVDVATALSEQDHPLRLHITIGPDL